MYLVNIYPHPNHVVPSQSPAYYLTRSFYQTRAQHSTHIHYPNSYSPSIYSCPLSSAYPLSFYRLLSICLGFSSYLIVLARVLRRGGGRFIKGRLVAEGKLVNEVRASTSGYRGRCDRGGLWVLAITADTQSCHHGGSHQRVCYQGGLGGVRSRWVRVLEVEQRSINLALCPDSVYGCCGR